QGEECHVGSCERVIPLAGHVERGVRSLRAVVVVSQACVKLNAGIEQKLVGQLESLDHRLLTPAAVQVVSQHDHEFKGEMAMAGRHHGGHLVLRPSTGAGVADDGEPYWGSRPR